MEEITELINVLEDKLYYLNLISYFNFRKKELYNDEIYRINWMISVLKSYEFPFSYKFNFDRYCESTFSIKLPKTYLNQSINELKISNLLKEIYGNKIDEIQNSLYKSVAFHKKQLEISKEMYKKIFGNLIDEILVVLKDNIPELSNVDLEIIYYEDISSSVEAFVQSTGNGSSIMKINLARLISYDKAQQLASHELSHYVQNALIENLFKKFPEMKIIRNSYPFSMINEGGAELAVDLIYDEEFRKKSLKKMIPEYDIDSIFQLEKLIWKETWPKIIYYSKEYINNKISKKELEKLLEEKCFKPNNSWPNSDFIERTKGYIQSYGWGRELIELYLKKTNNNSLKGYIEFMKKPVSPKQMMEELNLY